MTTQVAMDLIQNGLITLLMVAAPILTAAIIIGISVSLFQSMTQINEMTLVFVPKIVVVMLTLLFFMPWIVEIMIAYTRELFFEVPSAVL